MDSDTNPWCSVRLRPTKNPVSSFNPQHLASVTVNNAEVASALDEANTKKYSEFAIKVLPLKLLHLAYIKKNVLIWSDDSLDITMDERPQTLTHKTSDERYLCKGNKMNFKNDNENPRILKKRK